MDTGQTNTIHFKNKCKLFSIFQ